MLNGKILSVVLALLVTTSLFSEKFVIVTEEYPPYEFQKDGKVTGIDVEILQEAAKVTGDQLEFRFLPWKRAQKEVKEGKADGIISLFKTQEREEFLHFPTTSLSSEKNVIFTNDKFSGSIKTMKDLNGQKVGTMNEYSYGTEFDSNNDIIKEPNVSQDVLLKKLAKNRYYFVINNELVTWFMVEKLKLDNIKVTQLIVSEDPLWLGISKASPKGKKMLENFNKGLKVIKDNGTLDKVIAKYKK